MSDNGGTALVTGAGQGIGKAVAMRLLGDGYAVVISERNVEVGREAEEELASFGRVRFIETDVSSESSVRRCLVPRHPFIVVFSWPVRVQGKAR